MKKINENTILLDNEEQWYEDHCNEFVDAPKDMRLQLIKAAEKTQNKTERMNIRMSKKDMDNLKALAFQEGMPYQTLVSSVLHKYASGLLVDINEAKKILKLEVNT